MPPNKAHQSANSPACGLADASVQPTALVGTQQNPVQNISQRWRTCDEPSSQPGTEERPVPTARSETSPLAPSASRVPNASPGGVGTFPNNPAIAAGFEAIFKGGQRGQFLQGGWTPDESGRPLSFPPLANRHNDHATAATFIQTAANTDSNNSDAPPPNPCEEVDKTGALGFETIVVKGHFFVPNSSTYHAVREVVSHNNFEKVDDSAWPTARLEKGKERGHAQLKPVEAEGTIFPHEKRADLLDRIWKEREQLSDSDADVLDMLCAIWLRQAKTPNDSAIANVDQFLSMRGLEPKRGEGGRQSGYRPEQRDSLCDSIHRLESLWITLSRHEVYPAGRNGNRSKKEVIAFQSRALLVTSRVTRLRLDGGVRLISFRYRLGEIFSQFLFGPGRQIALLSIKAIQYDPYRQRWEKRLARYLSWQWRIRARSATYLTPFRVRTLLSALGIDPARKRPLRMQERFEKALDTLGEDKVIHGWQYENREGPGTSQCASLRLWLDSMVVIEPPDAVKNTYQSIACPVNISQKARSASDGLGELARQRRLERGIPQLIAAQEIGINHNFLCMIEKGRRKPSRSARGKIEKWLAKN